MINMDGDLMTVNLSGSNGKNMNTLFIINGVDSSQSTLLVENLKLGLPFEKFDNDTSSRIFQESTVVGGVVDANRGLVSVSNQENMSSENLTNLSNIRLAASDLQSASEDSLLTASEIAPPSEDQETVFTVASDTTTTSSSTPTTFTTTEATNDIEQVGHEGTLVIEEHPKKRTGGWPKGKKRKITVNETKAPRAPTTGYVLFQQERRQIIKKTNPEIPFAEVTKILGYEWSRLPTEDKERYLERAEEDKKRYREELKLYQQSEGYQTYQKWKKLKQMSNESPPQNGETPSFTIRTIEEEDTNELYCKVCDVYFVSIHNKKEHLYGRQHLQALTGEIHKEARKQSNMSDDESIFVNNDNNLSSRKKDRNVGNFQNPLWLQSAAPSNVNQAIHDFIMLNIARTQEICMLKKRLNDTKQNHERLKKELEELKFLEKKTEQELSNAKAYYSSLVAQLDSLRMVPALFGVMNF